MSPEEKKQDKKKILISGAVVLVLALLFMAPEPVDLENPQEVSMCADSQLTDSQAKRCYNNFYFNKMTLIKERINQTRLEQPDTYEGVLDRNVKLNNLMNDLEYYKQESRKYH